MIILIVGVPISVLWATFPLNPVSSINDCFPALDGRLFQEFGPIPRYYLPNPQDLTADQMIDRSKMITMGSQMR